MNEPASKFIRDYLDWKVLVAALGLTIMGLLSVFSATYDSAMAGRFTHQLIAASLGVTLMIAIMFASDRLIGFVAYPSYILSLLFLLAVLVIGRTAYGSKSWINLAGFSFQPAEFAKLTTVLALAKFFTNTPRDLRRAGDLAMSIGIVMAPVVLILLQPDVGTSIVFFVVLFGMLLWAGADLFLLLAIAAPPVVAIAAFMGIIPAVIITSAAVVGLVAFRRKFLATLLATGICVVAAFSTNVVYTHMKPHQQKRIEVFLHPDKDPLGAGYNELQAQLAVGSGGFFGKGYLHGTQTQLRYIPKQWTDFIYCVPAEEFGFIGGGLVIILFAVLMWRGVWIAMQSRQQFASAAAIGIVTLFLFHMFVNIGMTMGLFPVMGIPLPFLSYGGTFLIVDLVSVGLLLNFYRTRFGW
ncbi:MAG TPA: rod shape-determining protein RodA [Candidatus Kapabacteria bacterium]|nr:rod shape-determining protein RodA [Candidatus Kapabacteria bacterium]